MNDQLDDDTVAAILEDVPDALVIVDARGTIVRTNAAVTTVLRYPPGELLGQPIDVLVPAELRAVHAHHIERFADDPSPRPMGLGLELRARRGDGSLIPVEVALVPLRSSQFTAAFVRDVSQRRRLIDRLIAGNEVITAMAAGASRDETLAIGARRARTLLASDASWVLLAHPDTGSVEAVISGAEGSALVTTTLSAEHGAAIADGVTTGDGIDGASGAIRLVDSPAGAVGPWLAATFGQPVRGAVVVARRPGAELFDTSDGEVAEQFGAVLAAALELIDARATADRVSLMAEHERIARDLHDTVIQTVFAEGLRLEATAQIADGPVADRIRQSVDTLDGVIREIRAAIFQLQNSAADPVGGLRARVLTVTDEVTQAAGLHARVAFGGSVESRTRGGLGEALVVVLREALSNVVRHAQARTVEVVVDVESDALALTVADDGIGPPDHPTAGLGLVSLQARALELGGSFTIRPGARGSVVRWVVPLDDAAVQ